MNYLKVLFIALLFFLLAVLLLPILQIVSNLNGNGRKEALKRMEELTQLDKYIRIDK